MYIKHDGKKFNVSMTDSGNIRVNVRENKGRTDHTYKCLGLYPTVADVAAKFGFSADDLTAGLAG